MQMKYKSRFGDKKFNCFLLAYMIFVGSVASACFTEVNNFPSIKKINNLLELNDLASAKLSGGDILKFVGALIGSNNVNFAGYMPLEVSAQGQGYGADTNFQLNTLIKKAELAIEDLRLTRPEKNNALFFVKRILQLEPASIEANSLMRRAQQRYVDFFKQNINHERRETAQSLYRRADLLEVDSKTMSWMSNQLVQHRQNRFGSFTEAKQPISGKQINMRLTDASNEKKIIELAYVEMKRNRPDTAIALLKQFIKNNPDSNRAIFRLFEIYVSTNNLTAAHILMQHHSFKSPVLALYFKARMQAENGQRVEALNALSQLDPKQIPLVDILAYRAALAYKVSAIRQAYKDYTYLVKQRPLNSHYWLGLALALEAEKRMPESLQAYRTAQKINDQPAHINAHIQRKINQLSGFKRSGADKW